MTRDPGYLKEMAAHWRGLAEIGDPARRAARERWAAELDRLAESEAPNQEVISVEAEEKKP